MIIFFILLFIMYVIFLIYFSDFSNSNAGSQFRKVSVSVIIPARDEEKNIERCVEGLLSQTYPHELVQLILIDDNSRDSTWNKMEEIRDQNPDKNIKLLKISTRRETFKKQAITEGLKIAKGEIIFHTDADCIALPHWIEIMVKEMQDRDLVFLSGPVRFVAGKNLFEQIQDLEFRYLMGLTAGTIKKNFLLMCNGANLGYRRTAFDRAGGYSGNLHFPSGDDTFLMFKMEEYFPGQIGFLPNHEAVISTAPSPDLRSYYWQRVRWASKSKKYSRNYIVLTGIFLSLINISFPVALGIAFYMPKFFIPVMIKVLADFFFINKIGRFLKSRFNLWAFLMLEILYPIAIIVISLGSINGTYFWKGKKINS